jgi:WD40 repeat protein
MGAGVYGLDFSPDGRRLASGAWDGSLRVWDFPAKKEVHCLRGLPDLRGVAYSPDGQYIAAASFNGQIGVWDASSGARVATHFAHSSPALRVAFCPDGRWIASSDRSGTIRLSDALKPGGSVTLRGHTGSVQALAFHPDGTRLATGGGDGTAKIWDAWRGQEFRTLSRNNVPPITSLAYSPDGRYLASAGPWGGTGKIAVRDVVVWNVADGAARRTLRGHRQGVTGVTYSPDGTRLATSSLDRTLRLWDASTGIAVGQPLAGHSQGVNGVAYGPAGTTLVSAGADGTVRLWDAATGAPLATLTGHDGPVLCVASDPAGRWVATGGADGTVRLWEPRRRQALATLRNHDAPVNCLAFSPDGARLASGGDDHRVTLWDLSTGGVLFQQLGHSQTVRALAFSPDGRRVVSGSADWSIRFWAVPKGEEAFSLRGYAGEVSSLAFSPDGRQLVAGGREEGRIKVFEVARPRAARLAAAAETAVAWHRASAAESEGTRRWFCARFHLDRLLAGGSGTRDLLSRRGRANAESGRWESAAADFAAADRAGSPDMELAYVQALLRLRAGDLDGYGELFRKAIPAFGDAPSRKTANTIAWTGSLASEPPIDPARLVELAERAVVTAPGAADELNTLGAALVRATRYEGAVKTLERALQARGGEGSVDDWLVLALAHARLRNDEVARLWFEKAIRFLDRPSASDETTPPPSWDVRLSRQLFRDEARALIHGRE